MPDISYPIKDKRKLGIWWDGKKRESNFLDGTVEEYNYDPRWDGWRKYPIEKEELNDGEYLCNDCTGYGWIEDSTGWIGSNNTEKIMYCEKCQGIGKLDWIEMVLGKNPLPGISGYGGFSTEEN